MAPGFRILNRTRSVDARLVERFRSIPVANVSDTMSRMSAGGARLRPMHTSGAMAGPALTVKTRPGDNLMIHKAIDLAVPGDVIVIDGGGDLTNSLMGEIMLSLAIKQSIAGFVVDGAIRDADAFVEINLPVYAAGVSHRGPYKDGPGEINVPIAIDGMVIEPGLLPRQKTFAPPPKPKMPPSRYRWPRSKPEPSTVRGSTKPSTASAANFPDQLNHS